MHHRQIIGLCWVALALACALPGCDSVKAPPGVGRDTIPYGAYPNVTATDDLHRRLGVDPPIVEAGTEERAMQVTVPVRSLSDTPMEIQHRFIFYDRLGREVRSNQGWVFQHMEPRLQVQMHAAALETAAVNWRLEIRLAR